MKQSCLEGLPSEGVTTNLIAFEDLRLCTGVGVLVHYNVCICTWQ